MQKRRKRDLASRLRLKIARKRRRGSTRTPTFVLLVDLAEWPWSRRQRQESEGWLLGDGNASARSWGPPPVWSARRPWTELLPCTSLHISRWSSASEKRRPRMHHWSSSGCMGRWVRRCRMSRRSLRQSGGLWRCDAGEVPGATELVSRMLSELTIS